MKLQCSWPSPIDINGLDDKDQKRIRKIGLAAWIREQEKKSESQTRGKRG